MSERTFCPRLSCPSLLFAFSLSAACSRESGAVRAAPGTTEAVPQTSVVTIGPSPETYQPPQLVAPTPPEQSEPEENVPQLASPPPQACTAGPAPSVLVSGVTNLALSSSHVYWQSDGTIYRQAKAGGSPEKVTDVPPGGGRLFIEAETLYWGAYPSLFSMPLEGGNGLVPLVQDATEVDSWTARGPNLYYFSKPNAAGSGRLELRSVSTLGGASQLLSEQSAYSPLGIAADESGVYWYYSALSDPLSDIAGSNGTEPRGELDKYSFSTGAVTKLAEVRDFAEFVQTAGGRVLWAEDVRVWSSTPDGSERVSLGSAALFRGLSSDGVYAYWAASAPGDDYSDVFRAPLGGGEPQQVACHVKDLDWLLVDESAVYYYSQAGHLIARLPLPTAR